MVPQYYVPLSDNPKAGSETVTSTATTFPNVTGHIILIQNDPNNTPDLLIGDVNSQPIKVLSGQSITLQTDNLSRFWRKSAGANITVNYMVLA